MHILYTWVYPNEAKRLSCLPRLLRPGISLAALGSSSFLAADYIFKVFPDSKLSKWLTGLRKYNAYYSLLWQKGTNLTFEERFWELRTWD